MRLFFPTEYAPKFVSVRKRPIVVAALHWLEDPVVIATLEGDMTCDTGDFIIRGVNGEYYPCEPDIFEKTYEVPA